MSPAEILAQRDAQYMRDLQKIGSAIGYGNAQHILGELWDQMLPDMETTRRYSRSMADAFPDIRAISISAGTPEPLAATHFQLRITWPTSNET